MSGIGNMASMMAMSWIRMEVADMFSSALLSPIIEALVPKQGASLVMPKGSLYMNILFEGLATHCMESKRKCYIRKVPLVSHGIELVGHAMHIWASLHGFGNTLSGAGYTSSFLVRGANHKRGWYNKYYPCNRGVKGDKLSCDEYPFASTLNGGHANHLMIPYHCNYCRYTNPIDKECRLANFTVALTYRRVNRLLASLIPWFRLILLINTVQNIHFFE